MDRFPNYVGRLVAKYVPPNKENVFLVDSRDRCIENAALSLLGSVDLLSFVRPDSLAVVFVFASDSRSRMAKTGAS